LLVFAALLVSLLCCLYCS